VDMREGEKGTWAASSSSFCSLSSCSLRYSSTWREDSSEACSRRMALSALAWATLAACSASLVLAWALSKEASCKANCR